MMQEQITINRSVVRIINRWSTQNISLIKKRKEKTENSLGIVVLAGGKSSRMENNKSFLRIRGKPLIKHVVDVASEISKHIVITIGIGEKEEEYNSILPKLVRIVKDTSDYKAPIFGILSGLNLIGTEYAAVIASDLPFINSKVIRQLYLEAEGFDLAIPYWPNGNYEPLYAVYYVTKALNVFKEIVKAGRYRLLDGINNLKRVNKIPVDDLRDSDPSLQCFININTPEDLCLAEFVMNQNGYPR